MNLKKGDILMLKHDVPNYRKEGGTFTRGTLFNIDLDRGDGAADITCLDGFAESRTFIDIVLNDDFKLLSPLELLALEA